MSINMNYFIFMCKLSVKSITVKCNYIFIFKEIDYSMFLLIYIDEDRYIYIYIYIYIYR